ncbi:MAG: tail length tape measure protein, partial [Leptolyngbyaceae cyanobacterium SM1_4_3]|nr:tail length tape measure protein [Leptolyngbyaceae cyanobacterium SM1_4_3]
PNDPTVAEALFALGQSNPQYWDQAIAQFPAHPRSLEIAKTRLSQDPNQLPMLLVLARHGHHLPEITSTLDRIVNEYGSQLQPEDWERSPLPIGKMATTAAPDQPTLKHPALP